MAKENLSHWEKAMVEYIDTVPWATITDENHPNNTLNRLKIDPNAVVPASDVKEFIRRLMLIKAEIIIANCSNFAFISDFMQSLVDWKIWTFQARRDYVYTDMLTINVTELTSINFVEKYNNGQYNK